MVEYNEIETLETQLDALESSMAATTQITNAFQRGLFGMQDSLIMADRSINSISKTLSTQLTNAFGDMAFEGAKLSDVLRNVAQSMIQATFQNAMKPVSDGLSDLVMGGVTGLIKNLIPFENGAAFSSARVSAFAKGGVVTAPTTFPMRGGNIGLMGEAGAEAIMPLARGADGALGVRASSVGSQPITVNMNITATDAASFQRSRSQIAANVSRAIQRGKRNF